MSFYAELLCKNPDCNYKEVIRVSKEYGHNFFKTPKNCPYCNGEEFELGETIDEDDLKYSGRI